MTSPLSMTEATRLDEWPLVETPAFLGLVRRSNGFDSALGRLDLLSGMSSERAHMSAVFVDQNGEVWADDVTIVAALDALVNHPAMVCDEHADRCLAIAQWAIHSAITKDHQSMARRVWENVAQPAEWMHSALVWLETTAKCPEKDQRAELLREVLAGTDPQFAELSDEQCNWAMARLDESFNNTAGVAAKLSVDVGAFGYSRTGDVEATIERARKRFEVVRRLHAKSNG
jgi:hypothetical protein